MKKALDALERALLFGGRPVSEHPDPIIEPHPQSRAYSSESHRTREKSERFDVASICTALRQNLEKTALRPGVAYQKLKTIDLT